MKKISVFDTSISDFNLGNQIIMDSVMKHLYEMFPEDFFFRLPSMDITNHTIQYIKWSNLVFFGGTNSLNARMEKYRQWGVGLRNYRHIKDIILMGIGWWKYEDKTSIYTKFILRNILNKNFAHSTRDNYTKEKLEKIGICNVINTGCPTLWKLTREHCSEIPHSKSKNVVFTITDYSKNKEGDSELIDILSRHYDNLFAWIQGAGDYDHIEKIKGLKKINYIHPNLTEFDNFLNNKEVDYVGTRLHAGIRALQLKKRSIIVGIDNRAIEMKKDFDLPVVERNINALESVISGKLITKINIPIENIEKWKSQFKETKKC